MASSTQANITDAPTDDSQVPLAAPASSAKSVDELPQLTQRQGFGGGTFDVGSEQLLDLPILLEALVEEEFISQRQAEDVLIAPRTKKELSMHPLEIIAAKEYENRTLPGKTLDLETMTIWLSQRARQEYVRTYHREIFHIKRHDTHAQEGHKEGK